MNGHFVILSGGKFRRMAVFDIGCIFSEAGKYLRVVTEPDGETVHNAFFDRRFKP